MSDKVYRARSSFAVINPELDPSIEESIIDDIVLNTYAIYATSAEELLYKVVVNAAACIAKAEHPTDEEATAKRLRELSDRFRLD